MPGDPGELVATRHRETPAHLLLVVAEDVDVEAAGSGDPGPVDSEELADVIRRLRRAQGQIGGVIRMIEDGQECSDVLTQLAAAARALDRARYKIIASGLCQCALDGTGRPRGRGRGTRTS